MKKLIALSITALLLTYTTAFAAKGGSQSEAAPKALWTKATCQEFALLGTNSTIGIYQTSTYDVYELAQNGDGKKSFFQLIQGYQVAKETLITLWIDLNGFNMTLADVPEDGEGKQDCLLWNAQLLGIANPL